MRAQLPLVLVAALGACGDDGGAPAVDAGADAALAPTWTIVHQELPEGLTSVWGTTADDVWAVGGDAGDGPLVLHYDGTAWDRLATGITGDLWWVFGFEGGPIYMGGSGGQILRYQDGTFTPMTTPGNQVVFGIWGAAPGDLWAVGAALGGSSGAFAWRLEGDAWVDAGIPADLPDAFGLWKVYGRATDDVWLVGTSGLAVHWDGDAFSRHDIGGGESLFTVHCAGARCAAVGGFGTGIVVEETGDGNWAVVNQPDDPPVVGVALTQAGGLAVGSFGAVLERDGDGWSVDPAPPDTQETLHSVWIDPDGGAWAVGGQVQAFPLIRGVVAYRGPEVPGGEIR